MSSRAGVGTVARRRAVVVLVGAGVGILALLTVFAIELSSTQARSRSAIKAHVHERSVLAGALMDSLFQSVRQQIPQYRVRYGGRVVSNRTLDASRQQNEYLVLVDGSGRVLAASRGFTPQARADLAFSAALRLVRSGRPYGLGNILPFGRSGIVNFAVAFRTGYGERFLLTGFRPAALTPFLEGELRKIPGVRGARNYVIDGNDVVLASTDAARPVGYRFRDPAQVRVLSRPRGSQGGYYYDQVRLADSTWRIVLAAPVGPLFASVSGLSKWLPWAIFAAFALVAATMLALGMRLVRSAESRLREANERLETVNRQLEESNEALAHDALHDSLTGLSNRALFMDRLEQTLQRANRDAAIGCAVLFVDLDGFKLVNDSLSHAVGDRLLVAVAERFHHALRPGDTVARIGGDEFVLLLDGVSSERDATIVAERLQRSLAVPVEVADHELFVGASIGIALRTPQISAADLLRNADIAMYHAKRAGRSGFAVFDDTMHRQVVDRVAREAKLREAVERSLVGVDYQPIVDLRNGEIAGLEALARWPAGWPQVSPAEFVQIAEDSGLIGRLGLHVLRVALLTFADWRRVGLLPDAACLSVNVSRRQLDDPALPEQILDALSAAGVPGEALRLEITESTLMQEPEHMRRIISEVCAHGVCLHLDDFGTEYSSLGALLQFPVAALKIDRSFVTSLIGRGSRSEAIVRGAIALAHGLGLRAIAEGIEDPVELQCLRDLGCDHGQGFLFSKPLSAGQTQALLERWSPVHASGLNQT